MTKKAHAVLQEVAPDSVTYLGDYPSGKEEP